MTNCGLTHFKHHNMIDDNTDKRSIRGGAGHILAPQEDFRKEQFPKFRYGVLDLGEEALGWCFDITRPQLYEYCRAVFDICPEATKLEVTRNKKDWATKIALLNKLITGMHRDESDIKDGLAGVLQFGDAHGASLLFLNGACCLR